MNKPESTAVETGLFESVFGALDVGLLVFDTEDRLLLVNPWAANLFPALADARGMSSAEAAGLATKGDTHAFEGSEFRVGDRWVRARRRATENGGAIVMLSDISSEKQAEALLVDARDSAMLADRAKSEFLANMTHELRTPLNAVIGFAEVLRDELYGPLGNAQYHDFVADIHESGQHLLAVIEDILDLSKIEVGRREPRPQPMDITHSIDSAVRMLMHRAEAGSVTIECEYDKDLPVLNAEERGVKQILLNLLTNSVKFTPQGGSITVSAVSRDGLDLIVRDTGVGIAKEDHERVFTPFVQLDASGLQRYEGAGLGLALVKSLAEMHNATVTLESAVGEGTTVTVHFPQSALIERNRTR